MIRAVAIAMFVSTGLLAGSGAIAQDKPNVVCESDASGANMVCRDVWLGEDAAPFRRVSPAARSAPVGVAPKPPLPMLAPPPTREVSASQGPAYLRKSDASDGVERQLPSSSLPTIAERSPSATSTKSPAEPIKPTAAPLPSAAAAIAEAETLPPPASSAASKVQPIVATPPTPAVEAPVAATATTPITVDEVAAPPPPPVAQKSPPESPIEAIVVAPPAAPVEATAPPEEPMQVVQPTASIEPVPVATPAPSAAVVLLDGAAFRALDGSHYTLELANATTPQPLQDLAARLQLSGDVYLIHLRSPESDRWLLTWADHAVQSEARSARQVVPADSAINSGWPRRIAPLQNELVSP